MIPEVRKKPGGGAGRIALVTGGSRGIGRGIAMLLGARGYGVALTYLSSASAGKAVADAIGREGGRAIAVQLAVEDRKSIRRAMDAVRKGLGTVDVLVNNAAISQERAFLNLTDEDWDRVFAVDLRGPFACSQEVLPDMVKKRWGRIINLSCVGGQWGSMNQVHYACAKAGLNNLTRSLARLYSAQGVTTNTVAGGLVATQITANELQTEAGKEKVRTIPSGRMATVEDVAHVVAFLASDEASHITGQTINVNGGMYFGA